MQVHEVMTRFPVGVRLGADLRHAAEILAVSEVGQLMVLDGDGRFAGVLSEGDVLRALLPPRTGSRPVEGTVTAAFAAFLAGAGDRAAEPLDPLVDRDPITVPPGAHVAAAAVAMTGRGLRRLPVVEDGRLLGTLSRAEVCRAVLAPAAATGAPDPSDPAPLVATPPVATATPPTRTTAAPAPTAPLPTAGSDHLAAARAAALERWAARRPGTSPGAP